MKAFQEAINPRSSKSKITDALKHTLSAIMGSSFDLPRNKKVAQRWRDLDEVRGDEQASLGKMREHLSETHQELNIYPKGQLLRYELVVDMLKGKFNPECGLGSALAGDYHKGLSVICFVPYTPTERTAQRTKRKAQQMSAPNRQYEEAKEIITKARRHQAHTRMYAP